MTKLVLRFNSAAVDLVNELTQLQSQDEFVQKMVNYAVATQGEAFFKKQRDAAKKQLLDAVELSPDMESKLTEVLNTTKELDAGQSSIIADVDGYQLIVSTKRGAERLDKTKLRNALLRKFPAADVDAAILEASVQSAPAVSYIINEDGA